MGHKSCFICCKQCLQARNIKESKPTYISGTTEKNKLMGNQLQVIFLLRNLLEIPDDTCCKLLQHFGNPDEWIECCNSCSILVEKCQSILHQITSLEKDYDQLRMDIKYKILKSQKDFDYEYQCETIVRSHIISKDVDYFIKTTATEKGKEASEFVTTENIEDESGRLLYSNEEKYYLSEHKNLCDINEDPLEIEARNIKPGQNTTGPEFLSWNSENNEGLHDDDVMTYTNSFSHPEMDDEEIDVKPVELKSKNLHLFEKNDGKSKKLPNVMIRGKPGRRRPVAKIYKSSICDKRLSSRSSLHQHMVIHGKVKKFKCDICHQSFKFPSKLKRHFLTHSGVKECECDMCGVPFGLKDSLIRHQSIVHTTDKEYPYTCFMCEKSFTKLESLKEHYRKHTEKKTNFFKCLTCEETFSKLVSLRNHYSTEEQCCLTNRKSLRDVSVDPMESEAKGLKSLIQVQHKIEKEIPSWDSDEDGNLHDEDNVMTTKTSFGHQEIDEEEIDIRPLELSVVEVSDSDRMPLSEKHDGTFRKLRNVKIHDKPGRVAEFVKCSICGKRLASSRSLQQHMATHSKVRKFKCDICGQSFTYACNLKRHYLTHSNVKQYQCDMCGHPFSLKDSVLRHQGIVHTTDKEYPFTCVMCETSFTEMESLKEHYRKHTEEKSRFFKCLICGVTFSKVIGLKNHCMKHSEEKS